MDFFKFKRFKKNQQSLTPDDKIMLKNEVDYQVFEGVWERACEIAFVSSIAITGNYGIGKSSMIQSYENVHNQYYMHIPLTSFLEEEEEAKQEEGSANKKRKTKGREWWEHELLRQIVGRCHARDIPYSAIRMVPDKQRLFWRRLWFSLIAALTVLCMYLLLFQEPIHNALGVTNQLMIGIEKLIERSNAYPNGILPIVVIELLILMIHGSRNKWVTHVMPTALAAVAWIWCWISGYLNDFYPNGSLKVFVIFGVVFCGVFVVALQLCSRLLSYMKKGTQRLVMTLPALWYFVVFIANEIPHEELKKAELESLEQRIEGYAYLLLGLLLTAGVYLLVQEIYARIKLKSISIGTSDEQREFSAEIDLSLLDVCSFELIYIIDSVAGKYRNTFVFEDFDRLDNDTAVYLCTKLRDICNIVNDRRRGEAKVRFVYVLNDEKLAHINDYTKFFDFIIPIYPPLVNAEQGYQEWEKICQELLGVSSVQSAGPLDKLLKKAKDNNCSCLVDFRTIQCIKNEYGILEQLWEKRHDNQQLTEDKKEDLLIFVIYKVLFPKDYYAIRTHGSVLFCDKDRQETEIDSQVETKIKEYKKHDVDGHKYELLNYIWKELRAKILDINEKIG